MIASDLLRKRCLLNLNVGRYGEKRIEEYKILEIAPSGNWIKVMNCHGNKFWKAAIEIDLVEELIDLSLGKPEGEKDD